MTKAKKILLSVTCAGLLVVGSVAATIAYLTDAEKATNTFTVGDVQIELDEAKVTEDGKPVEGAKRVKENSYHLIPGQSYVKDPTVAVLEGSDESYVRMLVTMNKAAELKDVFGEGFLPQYFVSGWDSSKWLTTKVVEEDEDANTLTYEFRYYTTVKGEQKLEPLFTEIVLPGAEVDNDDLKELEGLQIDVQAHAIQAAGFENADGAWANFN